MGQDRTVVAEWKGVSAGHDHQEVSNHWETELGGRDEGGGLLRFRPARTAL